jgi:hypothetical protein
MALIVLHTPLYLMVAVRVVKQDVACLEDAALPEMNAACEPMQALHVASAREISRRR